MDDLCVHSKKRGDHLSQLQLIFEKCQLYRLCLNPDKCVFMVRQGKILGHVVSKNGISNDEDKIQVILQLPQPTNVKEAYQRDRSKSLQFNLDEALARDMQNQEKLKAQDEI